MRIAVVHSFYRSSSPSGENRAVRDEVEILQELGHSVQLFSRSSDDLSGARSRIRALWRLFFGRDRLLAQQIKWFRPDVIHVHNCTPNLAPAALIAAGRPLVVTVHNFRFSCLNGTHSRMNESCFKCSASSARDGVRFACYQDSYLKSSIIEFGRGGRRGLVKLLLVADRVTCVSETVRERLARDLGIAADVIRFPVLRDSSETESSDGARSDFLFVGRISDEKGLLALLRAWPRGKRLTIIGDGPARAQAEALVDEFGLECDFKGYVEKSVLLESLRKSRALLVPSLWSEGSPAVIDEAAARGCPVLVSASSGLHERGSLPTAGSFDFEVDSVLSALDLVETNQKDLVAAQFRFSVAHLSPGVFAEALASLFDDAIDSHLSLGRAAR